MIKIFQLYYDQESKNHCELGFIPKMNTEPDTVLNPFYENWTILDIFFNEDWQNCEMVGCVSWQFRQKTGLSYDDIVKQTQYDYDIYSLSPKKFNDWPHTFDRENINDPRMANIEGINEIIDFVDSKKILHVHLKTGKFPASYCNFWMLTPFDFKEYILNYLLPVVSLFQYNPEAKEIMKHTTKHGQKTPSSVVFFLEGLFSVFLSIKDFKYIQ